jgi:hypothetical protein
VTRPVPPPQRRMAQSGESGVETRPDLAGTHGSQPAGRPQSVRSQAQADRVPQLSSAPNSRSAEANQLPPSLPASPTDARGPSRKAGAARTDVTGSRQPIIINRNTVQAERNAGMIPPSRSQSAADGRPSPIIIRRGSGAYSHSENFGSYQRPSSAPGSQRLVSPPQSNLVPQARPTRNFSQPGVAQPQPTRNYAPQPSRGYSPTPSSRPQPSYAPTPAPSGMRSRATPAPTQSIAPAPRSAPSQRQVAPAPPSRPPPQAAPSRPAPAARQAPAPSRGNSGGGGRNSR